MKKRALSLFLASMMMTGMVAGTGVQVEAAETKAPKYVFLFIGDGMSYPQIQLTNYFVSANEAKKSGEKVKVDGEEKEVLSSKNNLNMMDFPVSGSAQTCMTALPLLRILRPRQHPLLREIRPGVEVSM